MVYSNRWRHCAERWRQQGGQAAPGGGRDTPHPRHVGPGQLSRFAYCQCKLLSLTVNLQASQWALAPDRPCVLAPSAKRLPCLHAVQLEHGRAAQACTRAAGREIEALFLEYEAGETAEARLVKDFDKARCSPPRTTPLHPLSVPCHDRASTLWHCLAVRRIHQNCSSLPCTPLTPEGPAPRGEACAGRCSLPSRGEQAASP